MATYTENLVAARDAALVKLLALESAMKFDHSIDGESTNYDIAGLQERINKYNAMIAMADGGFEIRSIGDT